MKELVIYYDDECPFCKNYSELVKLRSHFSVRLVDARQELDTMRKYAALGMDINNGFIVQFEGKVMQGEEAVVFLSRHMHAQTVWEKMMVIILRHKLLSAILYPIVKIIRIVTLFLLKKTHRIGLK